jgi:hypothetical protein
VTFRDRSFCGYFCAYLPQRHFVALRGQSFLSAYGPLILRKTAALAAQPLCASLRRPLGTPSKPFGYFRHGDFPGIDPVHKFKDLIVRRRNPVASAL